LSSSAAPLPHSVRGPGGQRPGTVPLVVPRSALVATAGGVATADTFVAAGTAHSSEPAWLPALSGTTAASCVRPRVTPAHTGPTTVPEAAGRAAASPCPAPRATSAVRVSAPGGT